MKLHICNITHGIFHVPFSVLMVLLTSTIVDIIVDITTAGIITADTTIVMRVDTTIVMGVGYDKTT